MRRWCIQANKQNTTAEGFGTSGDRWSEYGDIALLQQLQVFGREKIQTGR